MTEEDLIKWRREIETRLVALETVVAIRRDREDSGRRREARGFTIGGLVVAVVALALRVILGG